MEPIDNSRFIRAAQAVILLLIVLFAVGGHFVETRMPAHAGASTSSRP